jgi:hypothetical protein
MNSLIFWMLVRGLPVAMLAIGAIWLMLGNLVVNTVVG